MRKRNPGGIREQFVSLPTWVAPVALYVVAVIVYSLLGRRAMLPELFGDELIYGNLAQSLAHGDGFTWRDASTGLTTLIYPLMIAPAWVLGDGVSAYQLAKVINAAVICLVVYPVWLLAMRFVSPLLALATAALTLVGVWMEVSSKMMTENLAFPLALAAICSTVMACRAPDDRAEQPARSGRFWIWMALGLGAATAAVRLQLAVLPVVTIAALCVDSWRRPHGERAEVFKTRRTPIYIAFSAIVAVFIAVLVDGSLLGRFQVVKQFHPSVGEWAKWSVYQLLALTVMSGVVPFVIAMAVAIRPASWRDPTVGPLLSVAVPLAAALVVVSGWFISSNTGAVWLIERYVVYVIPLLILLSIVAVGRMDRRFAAVSVGLTALIVLSAPIVDNIWEAKSYLFLKESLDDLDGSLNLSANFARSLLTIAVGSAAVYLLDRRRVWPVLAIVAVMLGGSSLRAWTHDGMQKQYQAAFPNIERDWVVEASDGPVAMVFTGSSDPYLPQWVEFFNTTIKRAYALPGASVPSDGAMCSLTVAFNGAITPPSNCAILPRQVVVIGDGRAVVSFRDGQVIADRGQAGRLIKVPPNPRLLATVGRQPCDRNASAGCSGQVVVNTWLDEKAELTIYLRGPAQRQKLEVGRKTYLLEPDKATAIRIPFIPGFQTVSLPTDWSQPADNTPALVRAVLDEGYGPVEIYAERNGE